MQRNTTTISVTPTRFTYQKPTFISQASSTKSLTDSQHMKFWLSNERPSSLQDVITKMMNLKKELRQNRNKQESQ